MQNKKIKLTSSRLDGYLLLTYKDGRLKAIVIEFKNELTYNNWLKVANYIKPLVTELNEAAFIKLGLQPIELPDDDDTPLAGNERVKIFCEYFKAKTGIAYKVTRAAGAKMRDLPIGGNEFAICLKAYFDSTEWYLTPKSIENFCGKINEIRQLISSPALKKQQTKFPLPYDPEYAKGLQIGQLQAYWDVLRENGYQFVTTPGRGAGNWIKKTTVI